MGYRELPKYAQNINTDLINNTSVISDGIEYRNERFYKFILGTDYHINETNVITLTGNYALEIENQPSRTYFIYEDATGNTTSEWYRTEITEALTPPIPVRTNLQKRL